MLEIIILVVFAFGYRNIRNLLIALGVENDAQNKRVLDRLSIIEREIDQVKSTQRENAGYVG